MSLDDMYDLSALKNHTEELVFDTLEKQLKAIPDEDICKCNICVVDMACLALNQLKPKYRASLMGTLYTKAQDDELEKEVLTEVDSAIQKIGLNPAH